MRSLSIDDVRLLVDTSPPVFYPPKHRNRSSSYSNNARPVSPSLPQLVPSVSVGNLLPASASANDVSGIWEPVHRRPSIGDGGKGGASNPTRPHHRRAQSALPSTSNRAQISNHAQTQPQMRGRLAPSPIGRLQEYSRNPLASASAVSLPTLAELEAQDPDPLIPPSPLVRPRHRPSSRGSMISLVEQPPPGSAVFSSSVPPPQHSSMPPPSLPTRSVPRPPPSPSAKSSRSVSECRLHAHPRRPSMGSTSSVSDVAVLSIWSFPSSPEKSGAAISHSSERLKDRLRSLSLIDVSDPSPASIPSSPSIKGAPTCPNPPAPHLSHRHSHSSPTPLQVLTDPLCPPPRPQRKLTATNRLRQPYPLSMPHESPAILSSSPGSMVSDDTSLLCPSPTSSLVSLPPPVHSDVNSGSDDVNRGWLAIGRWGNRRQSVDITQGKERFAGATAMEERMESLMCASDEASTRLEMDEDYIDFDGM
ncbi:MAG: hypothetical protein TREMPRED_002511 [Tremellales sp. Tagirdzhanova-0007]|nr:MAG: hypothetical protein TREMPRED_002511 [Tremellales sp. Tagirdzhanova-0007]